MATAVRNDVQVTVQTPFMNLETAAGELRTTAAHVRRLIARGVLVAVQAGDDYRIRPADLDAYAMKDSPDFDAPEFESDGSWFKEYEAAGRAGGFLGSVRGVIQSHILPAIPRDAKGEPMRVVNVPVAGALAELIKAAPSYGIFRMAGQTVGSRFGTAGGEYAGVELRKTAAGICRRELNAKDFLTGTALTHLYRDPETYKRITAEAVAAFLGNWIGVTHHYPDASGQGRPFRVQYLVTHDRLGLDLAKIVDAAF